MTFFPGTRNWQGEKPATDFASLTRLAKVVLLTGVVMVVIEIVQDAMNLGFDFEVCNNFFFII